MQSTFISLMRFPGGENDGGSKDSKTEAVKTGDLQPDAADAQKEKGFIDKVKDALKEWSNNDEQDQQEDDTTP